jgi:hypothetical protein
MLTVYYNECVTGADTTYIVSRRVGWAGTASRLGTLIKLIFNYYLFICDRNLGVVQKNCFLNLNYSDISCIEIGECHIFRLKYNVYNRQS